MQAVKIFYTGKKFSLQAIKRKIDLKRAYKQSTEMASMQNKLPTTCKYYRLNPSFSLYTNSL